MIRRVLVLAGFAAGVWLAVGVFLSGRDEINPPPNGTPAVFNGGHAVGQRVDFRSWSADYDKLITNADQTVLDLQGVHNGIIFKNGKPYLRVRAAHMTINTLTRDFSATGPIHVETVRSNPRRTFDTTAATWSDATQHLSLPRRIEIHSGARAPLYVGSMDFDLRNGQLELHHVHGAIRVK